MSAYFVSPWGSDSNNGLGADPTHASNKPFLTLGKALGAAGIASGDTLTVCPGVYREAVTVAMTSATAETIIKGDIYNWSGFKDGAGNFVPGGVVRWTGLTTNDASAAGGTPITTNTRDYLTFRDFLIQNSPSSGVSIDVTAGSTNIRFERCEIHANAGNSTVSVGGVVDVNIALVFDACVFEGLGNGALAVNISAPTSTVADYTVGVTLQNCVFNGTGGVRLTATGVNSFKPGGVVWMNVSALTTLTGMQTLTNTATSLPSTVYNSFVCGSNGSVIAQASGQIVEDYNALWNSRANVAAGVHSVVTGVWSSLFESLGQGKNLRPYGTPMDVSPLLGMGAQAGGPSIDFMGLPRPCGTMKFGDKGTATSGAAGTLTDSGKVWGTNYWKGWVVKITSGTGSGQVKQVNSNTATALTVSGNWVTNPDSTSVYMIHQGARATSGKATAGAATTMTDSGAAWGTNQWTGFILEIRAGTGSGQSTTITSNTATALTVPTWGTNPDSTSQYWIYRQTSENAVNYACGAFERGDTWEKETTTVRTGSTALFCLGPATQDIDVPVDAVSTTISVYLRYDSAYAGTLPSLKIVNGQEAGVADDSDIMTGAADTWEQVSLTFTPARAGIVTIRLQSNCTVPTGFAFADDMAATAVTPANLGDYMRRGHPPSAFMQSASGGSSIVPNIFDSAIIRGVPHDSD